MVGLKSFRITGLVNIFPSLEICPSSTITVCEKKNLPGILATRCSLKMNLLAFYESFCFTGSGYHAVNQI